MHAVPSGAGRPRGKHENRTALFLAPCTALAAISFRRSERWLMVVLASLPLAVLYLVRRFPLTPLHHYDAESARQLFDLNAISVSVLIAAFGWLQADIYRRMETASNSSQGAGG